MRLPAGTLDDDRGPIGRAAHGRHDATTTEKRLAPGFLHIDMPGPHELADVRAERRVLDRSAGLLWSVAVCLCGWETRPHKTAAAARRAFEHHLEFPWFFDGF